MAIDSRHKRFNIMEFGGIDIVLPEADGAIDADDRAQLLGLYGGNALASPTLGAQQIPPWLKKRRIITKII